MRAGAWQRGLAALPSESTSFVGREEELSRVGALLGRSRLVTVTGPGGVGKTRLALRAAARAAPRFADGVVFAELSALGSADLLAHTVAACLGLPEQDARTQLAAVLGYLRGLRLLLVFDTCEHLVDACAFLAEAVLREAPEVTILATSRQPLDVAGENVCLLQPLPVQDCGLSPAAVELFAQRGAAVSPGFAVTDANRAEVLSLCRRLDGIPLAIELAAVRLRAFSLPALTELLESRSAMVTGERRSGEGRHRTLHQAIGWSYNLCDEAERELWARLSVFAAPFGLDAAEQVCADARLPGLAVVQAVTRLVDKSVLVLDAGARYRMLDTIREFGAERLAASGQLADVRRRHLSWYADQAAELDASPLTGQLARYRRLREEHADLRAALEHAFSLPAVAVGLPDTATDTAAGLATSLLWYWQISGLLTEGRYWLTRAIDRTPDRPQERAAALLVRGYLAAYQGDAAAGIADIRAGLDATATHGGDSGIRMRARGHAFLGRAFRSAGSYGEARAACLEATRLLDELAERASGSDAGLRAMVIVYQAYLDLLGGDLDGCVRRSAEGLALAHQEDGERWASSYLHGLTGLALFLAGHRDEGSAATRAGLAMKHELRDTVGIAYGLGVAAIVAAGQQRYQRAAWLLGAADPLWEQTGAVFSGTPAMQARVSQAEQAAWQALGDAQFTRLRAAAALEPLDDVLAAAVADAEDLARPAPPGTKAGAPLTPREREIAALVADGLTSARIAEQLCLSRRTVDSHLEHVYGKLGISSRIQLANWMRAG